MKVNVSTGAGYGVELRVQVSNKQFFLQLVGRQIKERYFRLEKFKSYWEK